MIGGWSFQHGAALRVAGNRFPSSVSKHDVIVRRGVACGAATLALVVSLATATGACAPRVNLATNLQAVDVDYGWLDVSTDGHDKVVPALSLRLRNNSNQKLRVLRVNAHFHSADNVEEWGTGFLTAAGSEGLAPGATTGPLVLKGEYGYTGAGVQRMVDKFVDTRVDLFVKYGAERWTRVGEYSVPRQFISGR